MYYSEYSLCPSWRLQRKMRSACVVIAVFLIGVVFVLCMHFLLDSASSTLFLSIVEPPLKITPTNAVSTHFYSMIETLQLRKNTFHWQAVGQLPHSLTLYKEVIKGHKLLAKRSYRHIIENFNELLFKYTRAPSPMSLICSNLGDLFFDVNQKVYWYWHGDENSKTSNKIAKRIPNTTIENCIRNPTLNFGGRINALASMLICHNIPNGKGNGSNNGSKRSQWDKSASLKENVNTKQKIFARYNLQSALPLSDDYISQMVARHDVEVDEMLSSMLFGNYSTLFFTNLFREETPKPDVDLLFQDTSLQYSEMSRLLETWNVDPRQLSSLYEISHLDYKDTITIGQDLINPVYIENFLQRIKLAKINTLKGGGGGGLETYFALKHRIMSHLNWLPLFPCL